MFRWIVCTFYLLLVVSALLHDLFAPPDELSGLGFLVTTFPWGQLIFDHLGSLRSIGRILVELAGVLLNVGIISLVLGGGFPPFLRIRAKDDDSRAPHDSKD